MQLSYTAEQVYELATSSKSCSYFARKYVIEQPLSTDQIVWLEHEKGLVQLGDVRRSYRTTTMIAKALWTFLFKHERTTLFVTHRLDAAHDMQRMFLGHYDRLPTFMKSGIKRATRDTIEGENGSTIKFRPATPSVGRGFAINLLLLDNMSLVRSTDYDEMKVSLLPCIATGGLCLEAK